MNAQGHLHECEMCLSITGRTESLLFTRGEIMSLLMNEVSVSPPKELQAVSYFERRDPFIFWLFLFLTLISSADISAAHVI